MWLNTHITFIAIYNYYYFIHHKDAHPRDGGVGTFAGRLAHRRALLHWERASEFRGDSGVRRRALPRQSRGAARQIDEEPCETRIDARNAKCAAHVLTPENRWSDWLQYGDKTADGVVADLARIGRVFCVCGMPWGWCSGDVRGWFAEAGEWIIIFPLEFLLTLLYFVTWINIFQ